jgi:hypothetical protein
VAAGNPVLARRLTSLLSPFLFTSFFGVAGGACLAIIESTTDFLREGRAVRRGEQNTGRNDIFGRIPLEFGGSWHSDVTLVTWATVFPAGSALLAQGLCFDYTQQITRLYEVGSSATFYIGSAVRGTWQAGRILAPRAISAQFYAAYTPPYQLAPALSCHPMGSPAPDRTATEGWDLSGVEVSGMGLQVTTGEVAVQQQVIGHFGKHRDARAR